MLLILGGGGHTELTQTSLASSTTIHSTSIGLKKQFCPLFPLFSFCFQPPLTDTFSFLLFSCCIGKASVINSNHREEKHSCRACPMEKHGQKLPTRTPVCLHVSYTKNCVSKRERKCTSRSIFCACSRPAVKQRKIKALFKFSCNA